MMKKILLACDLDNTLIHSLRHKIDGDVCIERIGEKEQGFMSSKTIDLLIQIKDYVELVPITTRSIEQYGRIEWPSNTHPRFAVTTNGSILLENGSPDKVWKEKYDKLVAPLLPRLNKIKEILLEQEKYIRVRVVDDMYLFAYCKDGIDINDCVNENKGQEFFDIIASGRKLYFFPHGIDKGSALIDLKVRLSPDLVISAGDSSIDLPMLNQSDIAIVPSSFLASRINKSSIIHQSKDGLFAEFLLQQVKNLMRG